LEGDKIKTMTIQEAIQKAENGGFETSYKESNIHRDLMNPKFWQCLGVAMGWEGTRGGYEDACEAWLYEWHELINWLASKKTIEDYFNNLTPPQKEIK
jgi:hypothetical protein